MAGPTRTCIGCRRRSSKAELIRLVSNATSVSIDERQIRPGRGAYLHRSPECAVEAVRRRALARALRRPGLDAAQLPELVRSHLGPRRNGLGETWDEGIEFSIEPVRSDGCERHAPASGRHEPEGGLNAHDHSMRTPQ